MTLSQFIDALDRYGSALDRWPPAERDAARRLLEQSAEATVEWTEAVQLEQFIRGNDPATAIGTDAVIRLSNAVMARLPAQPRRRQGLWKRLLLDFGLHGSNLVWVPRFAMSMAVAALLGFAASNHLTDTAAQQVSAAELLSMSTSYLPLDLR